MSMLSLLVSGYGGVYRSYRTGYDRTAVRPTSPTCRRRSGGSDDEGLSGS
mgnify:CR=1 FL=1